MRLKLTPKFHPSKVLLVLMAAAWFLAACTLQPMDRSDQHVVTPTVVNTPVVVATVEPSTTVSPSETATATATTLATETLSPTITPSASFTPPPETTTLSPGRVTVPILLYHHVSDAGKSRYFVSIAKFKAQMQLLADAGYQTVSISQVAKVIREGGRLPEKPVVLTFDDGFEDVYQNALPMLKQHHFTGVAYIITGTLGTNLSYGYMQSEELKGLVAAGWEIGSHSISHTDLQTSRLGMGTELQKSRQDLEAMLGVPVRSFSYPYGSANAWTRDQVKNYGYDNAVGLGIEVTQTAKRLFYLSRREVYQSYDLKDFRDLLSPGKVELLELGSPTGTLSATP